MFHARKMITLIFCVLAMPLAAAHEFKASYTTVSGCCGPDLNEDGGPGVRATAQGRSTLGPFDQETVLDVDPSGIRPATAEECDAPDTQVIVPFVGGSSVVRFRDGSMQFKNVAQDGRHSFACFDFVAGSSTQSTVHWTIVGGTQRFKGATGTTSAVSTFLANLNGLLVIEAMETGHIEGVRRGKHNDEHPKQVE